MKRQTLLLTLVLTLVPSWGLVAETILPSDPTYATPSNSSAISPLSAMPDTESATIYQPPPETQGEQMTEAQKAQLRLLQLFSKPDGRPASIVVFKPMDFTRWKLANVVANSIRDDVAQNGQFSIRIEDDVLKSLTLEEFRRAMSEYDADVLITTILKEDNFYIYLYDRRTPYFIYAHNEPISPDVQAQMSPQVADYYARVIDRKILYRYIQEEYFQLPRDESQPILSSEIPRWIASNESLALVNKDLESRFYGAVGVGAAVVSGQTKEYWTSNLVSFELGWRPLRHARWYAEGAFESFSYTSFIGSLKYQFLSKDTPFRIAPGLGLAKVIRRKSINFDETPGLGEGGTFVVPSLSIMVPIIDAYFKMEGRMYVKLGGRGLVFSVHPGIVIPF